jgi:hypothetical protein
MAKKLGHSENSTCSEHVHIIVMIARVKAICAKIFISFLKVGQGEQSALFRWWAAHCAGGRSKL